MEFTSFIIIVVVLCIPAILSTSEHMPKSLAQHWLDQYWHIMFFGLLLIAGGWFTDMQEIYQVGIALDLAGSGVLMVQSILGKKDK